MTESKNWYNIPAEERFLRAQARCLEILGQEGFDDLVTDYARGNLRPTLLESMEDFLKAHDAKED